MLKALDMAPILFLVSTLFIIPLTVAHTSATYTKIGVLSYVMTNSTPVKF